MVFFCSVSACAVGLLCAICGHFHTIVPTLILRFFYDRTALCVLALLASFADQMPACVLVLLARPSVIARRQYNWPPSPPLNSYLHFILWIHIIFQKYEFIFISIIWIHMLPNIRPKYEFLFISIIRIHTFHSWQRLLCDYQEWEKLQNTHT